MQTPERTVEEMMRNIPDPLTSEQYKAITQTLQAERQKREEMVEAEREKSIKALLVASTDGELGGKYMGMQYFSTLAHMYKICDAQKFINLTQPNNPK